MATVQAQPKTPTTILPHTRPSILLLDVRWETYEMLVEDMSEQRIRMTYDRGSLEIMSPSPVHEVYLRLLDRMISILTEELDIPIAGLGMMTCRREDLKRGLEPDTCFYVQNEPAIRDRTDIDLKNDPPPDLAIEVEVTNRALDKMKVYAALGVPEVWRIEGQSLSSYHLQGDGQYARRTSSLAFPFLPLNEVVRFMLQDRSEGETSWAKSFRTWVREHFVPPYPLGNP